MKRIYWHNFTQHHPVTFKKVQRALRRDGFHLVLKFDKENVCHDAYIVTLKPESNARAAG